MDNSPPSHIGKYEIVATLGKGAMGVVYKGHDATIDRPVAIKTIRKAAFSEDELADALGRFQREAQAAGRLIHPNIVTVYEYGEEGDTAFIAMEYTEGRTLQELARRRKPFSVKAVRTIANQLLLALHYAHEHGVVHRDIKLENLLLSKEGLKIMDFGIARVESSSLTSVGTFMGTPAYMAPELFNDQEANARSDLFSAGVVIYRLLTGRKPFTGTTMTSIMQQVINIEPPQPSQLVEQLPPSVDQLFKTALAKEPGKRFSSGREFAKALQKALADLDDKLLLGIPQEGGEGATIYQPAPDGTSSLPAWLQKKPLWLAGGALLLLFLAWLLWPSPGTDQAKEPPSPAQVISSKSAGQQLLEPDSQAKILAPAASKKRPPPPTKQAGSIIQVTSKPYHPQPTEQPTSGSGIRITVPQR